MERVDEDVQWASPVHMASKLTPCQTKLCAATFGGSTLSRKWTATSSYNCGI